MRTVQSLQWRRSLPVVQQTGNFLERIPYGAPLKDFPYHTGLSLVQNPPFTFTLHLNRVIAKASATCRKSFEEFTFQPTVSFLPKLLNVQTIGDAVHGDKKFTLLMLSVDALGNCYDADAIVRKPLMEGDNICKGAAKARGVVDQNDFEVSRGTICVFE